MPYNMKKKAARAKKAGGRRTARMEARDVLSRVPSRAVQGAMEVARLAGESPQAPHAGFNYTQPYRGASASAESPPLKQSGLNTITDEIGEIFDGIFKELVSLNDLMVSVVGPQPEPAGTTDNSPPSPGRDSPLAFRIREVKYRARQIFNRIERIKSNLQEGL